MGWVAAHRGVGATGQQVIAEGQANGLRGNVAGGRVAYHGPWRRQLLLGRGGWGPVTTIASFYKRDTGWAGLQFVYACRR